MRLDLHVHTVASDGRCSAAEVVDHAVAGGLDVIAVTDHDTTASVEPARVAARGRNLHVVAGTELSSTRSGDEIHVLGYFVDPSSTPLVRHQHRARSLRRQRMEGMVRRLNEAGVEVEMEAVERAAGPDGFLLARPHLARALVEAGHADETWEAFDHYIGDEHPAFIPTELQDPVEAVAVVLAAGGVPVWAHPPAHLLDDLLPELVEVGLAGLEVYRPYNRAGHTERLLGLAGAYDLLVSGGSDWHDPERNDPLGDFFVTGDDVRRLLEAGGI